MVRELFIGSTDGRSFAAEGGAGLEAILVVLPLDLVMGRWAMGREMTL